MQVFRNADLDGSFESYMKLSREEAAFDEDHPVPLMCAKSLAAASRVRVLPPLLPARRHATHPPASAAARFLSFPSTKDPTWNERFPGKCAAEIVTLAPFEWFEQWEDERVMKRGQDYDAIKAGFGAGKQPGGRGASATFVIGGAFVTRPGAAPRLFFNF